MSCLSDLLPGQTAYIDNISKTDISRRLCELGLVGGTRVKCVAVSSMKGPMAYLVRGALIALRHDDAKAVSVCRVRTEEWD